MRHVAIVNSLYPPEVAGGAEYSVAELAESLVAEGFGVTVICLTAGPTFTSEDGRVVRLHSRATKAITTPASRSFATRVAWNLAEMARVRTFLALRKALREAGPDVVHVNNLAGFGLLGRIAALRYPNVQTVRDFSLVCLSSTGMHGAKECLGKRWPCRWARLPYRLRLLRPDAIASVSRYVANVMAGRDIIGRHRGRADGTGEVIYNAPLLGTPAPLTNQDADADRTLTFGFIGRVAPDKGIDVLLAGFAASERTTASRMLIAGECAPEYRVELEHRFRALLDGGRLVFLGHVEPLRLFSAVDVVAIPTQWPEPFGRVAAEALTSGRAVMFSRAGGLPEVIELYGGKSIAVAAFRDAGAWARAFDAAVDGRFEIRNSHEPEAPTSAYLRLYRDVMTAKHPGARHDG